MLLIYVCDDEIGIRIYYRGNWKGGREGGEGGRGETLGGFGLVPDWVVSALGDNLSALPY